MCLTLTHCFACYPRRIFYVDPATHVFVVMHPDMDGIREVRRLVDHAILIGSKPQVYCTGLSLNDWFVDE